MNSKVFFTRLAWVPFIASTLIGLPFLDKLSVLRAQIRPIVRESTAGEVKETRAQPSRIDRSPVGPTKASRPAYSVLIVLTEPEVADISIDGERAGKATNGTFKTELRSGRQYKIDVSAGADYLPLNRVVNLKRGKYEIVKAPLTARYAVLRIFPAIDGAKILVDGEPASADKLQATKESGITLKGLTPGDHKLTYDLPGYVLYERTFKISPGSEYTWSLVPERAVVEMTVATEPKTAVYVDGAQVGTTPADGTLKHLVELGPHKVKLVKEDFEEYVITEQFEYHKPVNLDKRLVPLPTSAEFSDDFDVPKPHLWTMPQSGVMIREGRLYVENARALALPTNIRYRDFQMNFHLKLGNAGGASWAVRVKNSNDYYLFYLSGPDGLFPNRFNTYIVRNGEFDPKTPVRSDNLIARLFSGGQYVILIRAKGNVIEHQIKPAETGKTENLGVFEDKDNTFRLGGVGFRTVASEKFSVDDLVVNPR
ncbi:MAG: PEGA domain-containing protein [Blastocatellia bacterium]